MTSRNPGGDRPLPPHLDPRRGREGGSSRARTAAPAGAPRSRRPVVVGRMVAAVVSVAVLAASGWGWYLGQVADATVNRTDAIPNSGNEDSDGAPEALNLLLVGNDSRADLTEQQLAELSAGVDSGVNTDTMILVHIPADGSRASFVSFPRDSYVDIPGHGWNKLNAAYAVGYASAGASRPVAQQAAGAQLLVQTISGLTGLRIDHYAEVDLLGFFELTDVVGGVQVNLCSAVDDRRYSGAQFPAGAQTISGADALKFVRQRHGVRPDGSQALPRGDLDRIVRQQVFIAGVLRNILSDDVLLDLGKQRRLVEAAARSLTVDERLDLFGLAEQMQSVTAGKIEFQTIPLVGFDEDDEVGSIIRLEDEETLHRFFAELSAEPEEAEDEEQPAPVETLDPAEVSVEVLNGSSVRGLGASAADGLSTEGFQIAGTGNADSSDYTQTLVRHAEGDEAAAATVAAQIPGAVVEASDSAASGTVTLVLGSDFNGVGAQTTQQPAPGEEAAGEAPRTAEDQSCIN